MAERSRTWHPPKLTELGELDSHTGAATVSNSDGLLGGTLPGLSDSTS
ncbi:MAG TPA: hypothetical protein VJT75_17550 [Thermoleophilaceae bacterium]|nr:hypothetical protein [Thermoleophilaceae bacterium]